MTFSSTTFAAKLLLFGEYTILKGAQALAVPWQRFGGFWTLAETENAFALETFTALSAYLKKQTFEANFLADAFDSAIAEGLVFQSDIPRGYGVGSSGALSAAVYQAFFEGQASDLEALQQELGRIESFFHGSSSGVDPLISYVNRPVWVVDKNEKRAVDLDLQPGHFFLLDTGIARETEGLVATFLKKCQSPGYEAALRSVLVPATNAVIEAVLKGNYQAVGPLFEAISAFQWGYFQEMIPETLHQVWQFGLDSGAYALKLCGAGGGGYLLGWMATSSEEPEILSAFTRIPLP